MTEPASADGDPDDVAASPADDGIQEGVAIQALSPALPQDHFSRAVVVARQMQLRHPFVEAVITAGHRIGGAA